MSLTLNKDNPRFDMGLEVLSCIPVEPGLVPLRGLQLDFGFGNQKDLQTFLKETSLRFGSDLLVFHYGFHRGSSRGVAMKRTSLVETVLGLCEDYLNRMELASG